MLRLDPEKHREHLPKHIGIIMDGNGRWAAKRGLPRTMGHREGVKAFRRIGERCSELGIPYLTVYAFSTENWKRPKEEVDAIMKLLEDYLDETEKCSDENIRTNFIGDISPLNDALKEKIDRIQRKTENNKGLTVNIALNYGGRAEIVNAVKQLMGKFNKEDITEDIIANHLYTANQPDPDLIIRPSGEQRLSNFMIWQAAYSEYVFMDVLWPDFSKQHLDEAILQYLNRDRRFGGLA